ncbi:polyketide beta-ketoacyl:ACP synthase [Chitinophaga sp. Mgbs1]|uniref:Polyketide beta-ketoacyl:ACP synthase n=1 Tax=Chitinophaga solisilvae TaxID=1233460 RepID=A0A433WFB3_9BACT|nr:polyketide beta-ketoacyl:ACP synthase [Chitinophaga solisilvae]
MKNYDPADIVITGAGIITAAAQGKAAVTDTLLNARSAFAVMQRPGRQHNTAFLGAEIPEIIYPAHFSKKLLRGITLTGGAALVAVEEAWQEARLSGVPPHRIGLITGGSNFQQRELMQIIDAYREKPVFIRPAYGISFMDTDVCGLCTEVFNIRGMSYSAGGASASGQLAVLQAIQAVQSGQVDVCIALGALMDLSFWELQSLRTLGAMGSSKYADDPAAACRPFDRNRDGFIYGECSGAIVIERMTTAAERQVQPYAAISGWAMAMDGNRNPNPSYDGECAVIRQALEKAGIHPKDIDYINPHGSGSLVGDETELQALQDCGLAHAFINTTKSITGHGLTAAGMVEVIAVILQMKAGMLHPCRNLEDPADPSFNWVRGTLQHQIRHALSLSFGFGGINTALCLRRL